MFLVNEKCPKMKFSINKEIKETSEKGVIEIDEKDQPTFAALIASGFAPVIEEKKEKPEIKKEEQAVEETKTPEVEPVKESAPVEKGGFKKFVRSR